MAIDIIAFRTRHPEFISIKDDGLIQPFLDEAAAELVAADFISDAGLGDEYLHFLAADKIAKSPYAKSSRLVNEKGRTTYQDACESIWFRALTGL